MNRVNVVAHGGHEIVHIDISGSKNAKANIATFDEAERIIVAKPPKSVLLLTDVTDAHYDMEAVARLQSFSKAVTPFVRGSACLGVTGIRMIVTNTLSLLTGRNIKLFDDPATARIWLLQQ
jgi:hypothetical protein